MRGRGKSTHTWTTWESLRNRCVYSGSVGEQFVTKPNNAPEGAYETEGQGNLKWLARWFRGDGSRKYGAARLVVIAAERATGPLITRDAINICRVVASRQPSRVRGLSSRSGLGPTNIECAAERHIVGFRPGRSSRGTNIVTASWKVVSCRFSILSTLSGLGVKFAKHTVMILFY